MSCGYTVPCTGCKECEGFCQATATTNNYQQIVSTALGFSGAPMGVQKDDIIIKIAPKEMFNKLVDWLNTASNMGATVKSGGYTAPYFTGDFIKATDVNQLYAHFAPERLQPEGWERFSKDEVVYATLFAALFEKIRNAKFRFVACDRCNTTCDSNCKTTYQVSTGCSNCCNRS